MLFCFVVRKIYLLAAYSAFYIVSSFFFWCLHLTFFLSFNFFLSTGSFLTMFLYFLLIFLFPSFFGFPQLCLSRIFLFTFIFKSGSFQWLTIFDANLTSLFMQFICMTFLSWANFVLQFFFLLCLQVSFFSTSPELSNKQRFEYFTRTIPSDHYQVKAMVEIVRRLAWSYVSIIYEESNYGIKVPILDILVAKKIKYEKLQIGPKLFLPVLKFYCPKGNRGPELVTGASFTRY